MSMLQKILQDMYVEPEILADLDDEKKAILFCKMREEQLRRWTEREREWEEKERLTKPLPASSSSSSSSATATATESESSSTTSSSISSAAGTTTTNSKKKKRVRWLFGRDGLPWVWIMGEHSNDKTIEQILEEETQEKARILAEKEAEELRLLREEELKEKLRQEQLEAEEERMRTTAELQQRRRQQKAELDEEQAAAARRRIIEQQQQEQEKLANKKVLLLEENDEREEDNDEAAERRAEEEARLKKELQHQQYGPWLDGNAEDTTEVVEVRLRNNNNVSANNKDHQELLERRQSEIYQTLTEARERANEEAEKEAEEETRYWEEQERKARDAEEQIRSIARRAREQHKEHGLRTSTSLLRLLKLEKEQQQSQSKRSTYSSSKSTATAVEYGGDVVDGVKSGSSPAFGGVANPLPSSIATTMKLARPPKPQSRAAIVDWYLREELPAGSGLERGGGQRFAAWFHGIISREEAEQLLLLNTKSPSRPSTAGAGAFLVRVSARIWGYAISYKSSDQQTPTTTTTAERVKHFLIEKVATTTTTTKANNDGEDNKEGGGGGGVGSGGSGGSGYQLYGTNQVVHASLWDLVTYHKKVPITAKGAELLKEPVGQVRFPPDYQELLGFGGNNNTPTATSADYLLNARSRLQRVAQQDGR